MRIIHDTLEGVKFYESPNKGGMSQRLYDPDFIVLHYTAGPSLGSAVRWLTSKVSAASAHLIIGRDGEIVQLVRFSDMAWHAGRSEYKGIKSMNKHSIGIELVNAGWLYFDADTGYKTWYGAPIKDDDIFHGHHQKDLDSSRRHWQKYPEKQVQALANVCAAIVKKYDLLEIIGHDMCSKRKLDPGPALDYKNLLR